MSNVIALPLPIRPDDAEYRRTRMAEYRAHDARVRPTKDELRDRRNAKARESLALKPICRHALQLVHCPICAPIGMWQGPPEGAA